MRLDYKIEGSVLVPEDQLRVRIQQAGLSEDFYLLAVADLRHAADHVARMTARTAIRAQFQEMLSWTIAQWHAFAAQALEENE
jgi:hypothetical protein